MESFKLYKYKPNNEWDESIDNNMYDDSLEKECARRNCLRPDAPMRLVKDGDKTHIFYFYGFDMNTAKAKSMAISVMNYAVSESHKHENS